MPHNKIRILHYDSKEPMKIFNELLAKAFKVRKDDIILEHFSGDYNPKDILKLVEKVRNEKYNAVLVEIPDHGLYDVAEEIIKRNTYAATLRALLPRDVKVLVAYIDYADELYLRRPWMYRCNGGGCEVVSTIEEVLFALLVRNILVGRAI